MSQRKLKAISLCHSTVYNTDVARNVYSEGNSVWMDQLRIYILSGKEIFTTTTYCFVICGCTTYTRKCSYCNVNVECTEQNIVNMVINVRTFFKRNVTNLYKTFLIWNTIFLWVFMFRLNITGRGRKKTLANTSSPNRNHIWIYVFKIWFDFFLSSISEYLLSILTINIFCKI